MTIKQTLFLSALSLLPAMGWAAETTSPIANQDGSHIVAFPGAEGFGMFTTGGRGGKVYHVTSLKDDGSEGTLRWAVNQKGARTIVFDVSGTIFLKDHLRVTEPDLTIAGQTAPGDGICVADMPFTINASNVIVRYMRFRLGNDHVDRHEGDGLGGSKAENIIVDHCSVSWSVDECLSVYGNRNSTVQWCIVDQSLVNAGHQKGPHGYGGNWGGAGASYHHNLIAHCVSRVPRLGPSPFTQEDERMDLRNNVFYNWAGGGCYGGEAMDVNIINNYYKPGPATDKMPMEVRIRIAKPNIRTSKYCHREVREDGTVTGNVWNKMWHVWGHFFLSGNVNADYPEVAKDNWNAPFLDQISTEENDGTYTSVTRDTICLKAPIFVPWTTTQSAEEAYDLVLKNAGASLHRDSHDAMIVSDVRSRKASYSGTTLPGHIDTPYDNKPADAPADWSPWPVLKSTTAPKDTDGDGMPDIWEKRRGLNPDDPSDGAAVSLDKQFTNLEVYLNELVTPTAQPRSAFSDAKGRSPRLFCGPNEPLGVGKGIHPGRVAWVHNPGVATWDGTTGLWVEDRWNDQQKADRMVTEAVKSVAGESDAQKAWKAIFLNFNKTHGRGDRGYKKGESIAIKLNMNNAITHHDTIELNSSPFLTLALVRSMVNDGKVRQQDIVVCEPSRVITDSIYNKIHREFPKVRFVDNLGGDGREKCEYYPERITYSVDNGKMARGLAKCVADADYLINSALLKTHSGPGVTLTGKNWYGATDINLLWRQNAHNGVSQDKRNGKPAFKTFVDWISHPDMGGKCLLFLIDGTYGSRDVNGKPFPKWQKAPFNGEWACSLILSQDPLACDAVAMDLLMSEWPEFGSMNYCDEYLLEAATIPNTNSGTVYKQNGKPLTEPLGLFEHCDKDRKYTKLDLQQVNL